MRKMKGILTRLAVGFGLLAGLAATASAQSQPVMGDLVLGRADAPVTIIEYASFTCPHCAAFHAQTFPQLKTGYIDTGKVKFIFRDFPFDEPALRASQLARCAGPERYYGFVSALFQQQQVWARAADPIAALQQLARVGGMSEEEFRACLANKQVEEVVLKNRLTGNQEHKVNSTPSFLVNGKLISGAIPYDEFEKHIQQASASGGGGQPVAAGPASTAAPGNPAAGGGSGFLPWVVGGLVILLAGGGALFFLSRRKGS